ncbi:MAG: hypothetical protein LDLANPLL_02833 [Turneriella sp.]|nr:hypothetical protein [Turneriella sp.]
MQRVRARFVDFLICELLAAEARVGQPVVLLSATLPFSLRERFCQSYADGLGIKAALQEREKYPLLTQVSRGGISETQVETRAKVRRTVDVEFVHDEKNIESLIKEAVDKGQCVCWLRNTVADAVVAYTSLKGQLGDHAKLWLTAKWLTEHKRWQMPNDAHAMIEFVYGGEQSVPASLQDWTDTAEQKDNKKESLAAQNTINFSRGYTAQNEGDWDDLNAPSRYSEEKTVKVVLATLADGVCQPIREQKTEDGRRTARSWAASEINLPAYIAAVEDKTDPVTTTAIKQAKEQFSLKGKYTVFVILSKNDIGYSGFAVNSKGQRIKILYNHDTGLERESV